jgi:hypothetical protein
MLASKTYLKNRFPPFQKPILTQTCQKLTFTLYTNPSASVSNSMEKQVLAPNPNIKLNFVNKKKQFTQRANKRGKKKEFGQ